MSVESNFDQRLNQIQALSKALAARREELIQVAITDIGFSYRDNAREVDRTVKRLPAFSETQPWLAERRPMCESPEQEVALMLPYDGSAWLNIAIASIYLAGNRVCQVFVQGVSVS